MVTEVPHQAWTEGPLYLYHRARDPRNNYGVIERLRFQFTAQATTALARQLELKAEHEKPGRTAKQLMCCWIEPGDVFLLVDGNKLSPERARKVLRRPLDQICHFLKAVVKVQFGPGKRLITRCRPQWEWDVNEFPFYLYHEQTGGAIAPAYFDTTLAARNAVAKHLSGAKKLPLWFDVKMGDTFLVLNRVQIPPKRARRWILSGALNYGADGWGAFLHGMIHVSHRKKPYARLLPANQRRPNMH